MICLSALSLGMTLRDAAVSVLKALHKDNLGDTIPYNMFPRTYLPVKESNRLTLNSYVPYPLLLWRGLLA